MLGFIIEAQMGSTAYSNYLNKDTNQKSLLKAERTWRDIFVAAGNGTRVGGCEVKDFMIPDRLCDITRFGNLIISERYLDKMLDEDYILSKKSIKFPLNDVEYENVQFFKEVDDLENKGKKKLVRKYGLDLDDYTPMTVEEWNLFWSGINKVISKTPFQFKAIVKEPMILSNLGGIKDSTGDNLLILNDNINNSWELAFLLGYETAAFDALDFETVRAKDLKVNSYLTPFANEIYHGDK